MRCNLGYMTTPAEREAARRRRALERKAPAAPPATSPAPLSPAPPAPRRRRTREELAPVRLDAAQRDVERAREYLARMERVRDARVLALRGYGWTWEAIAERVGLTRQALVKRLGR